MTDIIYDTHGPRYAEASPTLRPGAVALFGACYDGTTSFRPGARFGPDALRAASLGLETYSPDQKADTTEDIELVDLGNLELPTGAPKPVVDAILWATRDILAADAKPLLLGGEHSVSIGAIHGLAEIYSELVLVQFDAHADLRADYLGDPNNHACAIRRALDVLPSENVLQVGIRSGTREEFEELHQSGRLVAPSPALLEERLQNTRGPIYLTVDLDVFDPAYMPGTGTPEPGGIDWQTFAALLATIPTRRLVAADVVELAPNLDPTGCSAVLAAKVVREVALKLGR